MSRSVLPCPFITMDPMAEGDGIGDVVFDPKFSMRYFDFQHICGLACHKVDVNSELCVEYMMDFLSMHPDTCRLFLPTWDGTIDNNLRALFLLSTILKERFTDECSEYIDNLDPELKVRLAVKDIVTVFLNWGASLKSLGLPDTFPGPPLLHYLQATQEGLPTFRSYFNDGNIEPSIVRTVLSIIIKRLPIYDEDWDSQSKILLKALVRASLDPKYRSTRIYFCNVIHAIIESFPSWTDTKTWEFVDSMDVGANNQGYLVHAILTPQTARMQDLASAVAFRFIQQTLSAPFTPTCFLEATSLLVPPEPLIARQTYQNLIIMLQLFTYLTERYIYNVAIRQEELMRKEDNKENEEFQDSDEDEHEHEQLDVPMKTLKEWCMEARELLKHEPYKFSFMANVLYGEANRMTSYINSLCRNYFFTSRLYR